VRFFKTLACYTALVTLAGSCYASSNFFTKNDMEHQGIYLSGSLLDSFFTVPQGASFGAFLSEAFLSFGVNLGYQFSDYFAIQTDYLDFASSYSDANSVYGPDHYYLYSIDLLGKFMFPVGHHFSFNAYAGAAVTNQNTYNQFYIDTPPLVDSQFTEVMPEVGGGVEVYFAKYISMGVGYFYLFSTGNIDAIQYVPVTFTVRFKT